MEKRLVKQVAAENRVPKKQQNKPAGCRLELELQVRRVIWSIGGTGSLDYDTDKVVLSLV